MGGGEWVQSESKEIMLGMGLDLEVLIYFWKTAVALRNCTEKSHSTSFVVLWGSQHASLTHHTNTGDFKSNPSNYHLGRSTTHQALQSTLCAFSYSHSNLKRQDSGAWGAVWFARHDITSKCQSQDLNPGLCSKLLWNSVSFKCCFNQVLSFAIIQ